MMEGMRGMAAGMPESRRRRRVRLAGSVVLGLTLAVVLLAGCDGLTAIIDEYNSRFTGFVLTPDGAAGGYTFGYSWTVTLPVDSIETPENAKWYITPAPTSRPGGDVSQDYKEVNGKKRLQFKPSDIGMNPGNYELRIEIPQADGSVLVGRCALWCTN